MEDKKYSLLELEEGKEYRRNGGINFYRVNSKNKLQRRWDKEGEEWQPVLLPIEPNAIKSNKRSDNEEHK